MYFFFYPSGNKFCSKLCRKCAKNLINFHNAKLCPYCVILCQYCARVCQKFAKNFINVLNCVKLRHMRAKYLKCVWFGTVYPQFGTVYPQFGTVLTSFNIGTFCTEFFFQWGISIFLGHYHNNYLKSCKPFC